jgi:hypothetical protein
VQAKSGAIGEVRVRVLACTPHGSIGRAASDCGGGASDVDRVIGAVALEAAMLIGQALELGGRAASAQHPARPAALAIK